VQRSRTDDLTACQPIGEILLTLQKKYHLF
jgi:hypothetical protein